MGFAALFCLARLAGCQVQCYAEEMDAQTAQMIITRMLAVGREMQALAGDVMPRLPEDEAQAFKKVLHAALGSVFDVYFPLFKLYPDLIPADLKGQES